MTRKIDNLALIGGDNELPLVAYNSIKKNLKILFISIYQDQIKKNFSIKNLYII
jgi:hypothetical protein